MFLAGFCVIKKGVEHVVERFFWYFFMDLFYMFIFVYVSASRFLMDLFS